MFKEKYIRDNELIKPDDDFLERLQASVQQEENVVHIGEYVDFSNVKSLESAQQDGTISRSFDKKHKTMMRRNLAAVAACFILIIAFAFAVGKTGVLDNKEALQAGMEDIFHKQDNVDSEVEDATSETIAVDAACQEQYDQAYQLFLNGNGVIYEVDAFGQESSGISYLQEVKKNQSALDASQRDELLGNILAENYTLVESLEEFDDARYYIAVFDNDACVYFAIDSEQYIYIEAVSGIQSLAYRLKGLYFS